MVDLAAPVGITVIAVGIETAKELETLADLGPTFGPGYRSSNRRPWSAMGPIESPAPSSSTDPPSM